MVKELIINSTPAGVTIALIEDKQLVELHKEQINNNYAVGDIYLGRIKKIMPGLNAAFVDVGYEKDAFLHYFDLGPQVQSLIKLTKIKRNGSVTGTLLDNLKLEADINKAGKISDVLSKNMLLPVQIAKEPNFNQGATFKLRSFYCRHGMWYWCHSPIPYPYQKKLKVIPNVIA